MQSQQWLPASDSKASPPASPGPIRRSRRVRQLQPYEPAPVGKAFRYPEGKKIYMNVARKKVRTPPSVPVVPESAVLPPPTIFYRQTTTVPVPLTTLPPTSPPSATHSAPMPPHQRAYAPTKGKGCHGPKPQYNRCKLHHNGPCTIRCHNCQKVGRVIALWRKLMHWVCHALVVHVQKCI